MVKVKHLYSGLTVEWCVRSICFKHALDSVTVNTGRMGLCGACVLLQCVLLDAQTIKQQKKAVPRVTSC